jgi:hypothetical protein
MPEDRHAVVWPRGRKLVERRALAPRLPSLGGRTIAFLWNHVFRPSYLQRHENIVLEKIALRWVMGHRGRSHVIREQAPVVDFDLTGHYVEKTAKGLTVVSKEAHLGQLGRHRAHLPPISSARKPAVCLRWRPTRR